MKTTGSLFPSTTAMIDTGYRTLGYIWFSSKQQFFFFLVLRISQTLYKAYLDFKKDFFSSENPVSMFASSDNPNDCRSVPLKYGGLVLKCADLWVSDTQDSQCFTGPCRGRCGPRHLTQWKPPSIQADTEQFYMFVAFIMTNMLSCSTKEGMGVTSLCTGDCKTSCHSKEEGRTLPSVPWPLYRGPEGRAWHPCSFCAQCMTSWRRVSWQRNSIKEDREQWGTGSPGFLSQVTTETELQGAGESAQSLAVLQLCLWLSYIDDLQTLRGWIYLTHCLCFSSSVVGGCVYVCMGECFADKLLKAVIPWSTSIRSVSRRQGRQALLFKLHLNRKVVIGRWCQVLLCIAFSYN